MRNWGGITSLAILVMCGSLTACSGSRNGGEGGSSGSIANSACSRVCNKAQQCNQAQPDCLTECSRNLGEIERGLQPDAADEFRGCVQGSLGQLESTACADLGDLPNCVEQAMRVSPCYDPGWAEYAQAVCGASDCDADQEVSCVEFITSYKATLPCINEQALGELVTCSLVSCSPLTPASVPGGPTISQGSYELECEMPGGLEAPELSACCAADNPCEWEEDGVCDCGGDQDWDSADCGPLPN